MGKEWLDSNDSMKYSTRDKANEFNKWCSRCKVWISKDSFYKNKHRYDGLSSYCNDCEDECKVARDERRYGKKERKQKPRKPREILDNVMIVEAADSDQQERVINDIDSLLKDKGNRFKLLVVDSPVTHYRSEYVGREMLPMRQQKLYRFMRRLVTIAHACNIAVIVTNQINTAPDSQKICPDGPIGGNAMNHAVTYSVRLWG
jgi:RecA/RadA recombinase